MKVRERTCFGFLGGRPSPATKWRPSPAGDAAVVQPTRVPTPEALRLMRWYSVGFDPQRNQQAPPHHRLHEPVPINLQGENYKDAMLLEMEREALYKYATGAFAFCEHSTAWQTLKAHLHKCPGKKGAAHLWRGSELEMSEGMVQDDADRYYWWFLSPQAACTRASLNLLPPVPEGPAPPTSEQIQQWCTTMRLSAPEPLTQHQLRKMSRENRVALYQALTRLTALDKGTPDGGMAATCAVLAAS